MLGDGESGRNGMMLSSLVSQTRVMSSDLTSCDKTSALYQSKQRLVYMKSFTQLSLV